MDEYERLKEYSENIVESINVGILADGPGRPRGELELADREADRHWPGARDRKAAAGTACRPDLCDQIELRTGESGAQSCINSCCGEREATLNIAIAPLFSRDAQRIGRLVIFDDITDREELEKRLVQADKLSSIGLLAAGVAHEVNTPLAVISTYAQMLAKQISGDAQKAPLLEKIARQTFRASEIVNSLLNFSRTSPTEFAPLDLNKIVRETLTLVEHQLTTAGVRVELVAERDAAAHARESGQAAAGVPESVFERAGRHGGGRTSGGGDVAKRTARCE